MNRFPRFAPAEVTRRQKILVVIIPILFLFTLKTHPAFWGDGDEPHYLLIAESLYDDGDLRLENQYPDRHSFIPALAYPGHTVSARDGSRYPVHDIGLPVLMIPTLHLVHLIVPHVPETFLAKVRLSPSRFATLFFSWQSMVLSGFLALLLLTYFRRKGFSPRGSFGGSLIAVLTPPIMTHGYLFFTELYSTAIVLGMVLLLEPGPTWRRVALYSLGAFVLSWLHLKNLLLVTVLCALWLFAARKSRLPASPLPRLPILLRALPALIFALAIVLRAALHEHYFGRASLSAAWGGVPLSPRWIPHSFLGLFFDREFGLLFANPLFFLLPFGLWVLAAKGDRWFRREGVLLAAYLGGILMFKIWWAGWSPAARHLVPIIPLAWYPLLAGIRASWRLDRWARLAPGVLLALTLFLVGYWWQRPRLLWGYGDGVNRWMAGLAIGGFDGQRFLPSLMRSDGSTVVSIIVWGLILATLTVWLGRRARKFLPEGGGPAGPP